MKPSITWHDPRKTIWGFHVHQELPQSQLASSLVVQQGSHDYLNQIGATVDADDVMQAGYGPHINPMWELRVESEKEDVLEKMGQMISFLSINRMKMPAYIHPLMHDPKLPDREALKQEGLTNQVNALWFGEKVAQNQSFFFEPPFDASGNIVDTRTSRIIPKGTRQSLLKEGKAQLKGETFQSPEKTIIRGFHIHMDVYEKDLPMAESVFDAFVMYLLQNGLRPTSTRFYAPRENGPHVEGGWEVKFEQRDPMTLKIIGIAIGWLMCNRQDLPVFIHPVTWEEGDHEEEIRAHEEYAFFLGELVDLDLDFFRKELTEETA